VHGSISVDKFNINMTITCKTIVYSIGLFALLFVGIPVSVDPPEVERHFIQFIQQHNKSYDQDSPEYDKRYENFKMSYYRALEANHSHRSNGAAFGITKFSDLSPQEFREMMLRHHPSSPSCFKSYSNNFKRNVRGKRDTSGYLPTHIDWREKNAVTKVKNQKNCGACWAFSIVETIESMYAIATGKLKDLSIQQVIDCATFGNFGCMGGDTCTALDWMVSDKVGLVVEQQYPLTLQDQECNIPSENQQGIHILSNYTCFNMVGEEEEMKNILAFHGPVTAAVDASSWQDYLGGIIQFNCDQDVNHAVEVVGYDNEGPVPYFILRNSWGPDYGIDGYLHVAVGNNLCGIAREVSVLDVQV